MRNTLALVATLALAIVGMLWAVSPAQADMVELTSDHGIVMNVPAHTMESCEFDELVQDVPCVWNAPERANEIGESFVALGMGQDQVVISITDAEAEMLERR